MFKIAQLFIISGSEKQEYDFTTNTVVYGPNTVGKTAMVHLIDFALGRTDGLAYDGLDNIDAIEMLLTNKNTNLWVKRTVNNDFYYKRTEASEYTIVTEDAYKTNISEIINETIDKHILEVYQTVFEETPSYRMFSFLNFLDEKSCGDLTTIFTRAREPKHLYRIRNIMDFLFNYDNIEKLYNKELELKEIGEELSRVNSDYSIYISNRNKVMSIFRKLDLKYEDDVAKDKETYLEFKNNFERKPKSNSKDLVYLARTSFDLSEELKMYTYMKTQMNNSSNRNKKIEKLLLEFKTVLDDNPQYEDYVKVISSQLEEIKSDQIIFSIVDYREMLTKVKKEKEKIDIQLNEVKTKAMKLDFEETEKQLHILENCFEVLESECNISKKVILESRQKKIKAEIKVLKSSYNHENVEYFNDVINKMYLNETMDIKHLKEDMRTNGFKIFMDPFRLALYMQRKDDDGESETYNPGSLARQTHIQIIVYLAMIKYIKEKFKGLVFMPLLVIDSANQCMTYETGKILYQDVVRLASELQIQTIFLTKEKLIEISDENCIDISMGLNRFHKK